VELDKVLCSWKLTFSEFLLFLGGASLQQAATLYQIPKTVLWRRVRSAGGRHSAQQKHTHNQSVARRQAAVEALQNGHNLSKVSDQFQVGT